MLFSGDDAAGTPPPLKSGGPPTLQEGAAAPPPKPVHSARYSAVPAAAPKPAPAPPRVTAPAAPRATAAPAAAPKVAPQAPALTVTPVIRPQSFVPWPRSTPPAARALELLTRAAQDEETEPLTAALLASLTAGELAALLVDGPLREAVLMRWRLAWALDRKPAPGVAFEESDVEALLAEADTVMGNLPVSEEDPLQKEALGAVRGALARDAVALSELSHRLLDQAKQLRAPRPGTARTGAQRMTVEAGGEVAPNRQRWLIVATVLLAVGAGTFQAITMHNDDVAAQRRAPKDVPAGTSGTIDHRSGMAILHKVDGRFDETAVRHFKAQAEQRGMKVIQVSNGDYLAVPSDKPISPTP